MSDAEDNVPLPQSLVFDIDPPVVHQGVTYKQVTMRAPTVGETMKATAVDGRSNLEVACRMVETIAGVPYEAVQQLPEWMVDQMIGYISEFARVPAPGPLERYRESRRRRALALEHAEQAALATASSSGQTAT